MRFGNVAWDDTSALSDLLFPILCFIGRALLFPYAVSTVISLCCLTHFIGPRRIVHTMSMQ